MTLGAEKQTRCVSLEVHGQPPTAVEPGERAFDNPTPRQNFESVSAIRSVHDLNFEVRQLLGGRRSKGRHLIAAIGKEYFEKWVHAKQGRQNRRRGGLEYPPDARGREAKDLSVNENVPHLALDLFARIITVGVNAGPLLSLPKGSALFTLWLSITQAVGGGMPTSSSTLASPSPRAPPGHVPLRCLQRRRFASPSPVRGRRGCGLRP